MSDEQLETVASEQASDKPANTSTTTPASAPVRDYDAEMKAAVEQTRREAQAAKDRELAQLHRQYQERERAVLGKAKQRFKTLGDENPDAFDHEVMQESELAEFRAYKQQKAAADATRQTANEICSQFGLSPDDPRLKDKNYPTWQDYTKEVARLAAADERARQQAEKERAESKLRKETNERVASGELSTLPTTPTAPLGTQATLESVNAQLSELMKSPTKNAAMIAKLAKRLEELEQRQ